LVGGAPAFKLIDIVPGNLVAKHNAAVPPKE